MKTALFQIDIKWNDREANLSKIEGLVSDFATGAGQGASSDGRNGGNGMCAGSGKCRVDLIVLPEMFTTGFAVDPAGIAEPDGGAATLAWMRSLASRTDAAVTGSVAVREGNDSGENDGNDGRFYNRMFFVRPDGSWAKYDKRHLFSFAGEDKKYTAGTERVVVEWRDWRILLQVCYDLRFPVFARNRGDYDMIVYAANWPTVRIDAWNSLIKARAIENLCYLAASNRTGRDPFVEYTGGTCLLDFKGTAVASNIGADAQVVVAEADMDALKAFRQKFPALDDGDDFALL